MKTLMQNHIVVIIWSFIVDAIYWVLGIVSFSRIYDWATNFIQINDLHETLIDIKEFVGILVAIMILIRISYKLYKDTKK